MEECPTQDETMPAALILANKCICNRMMMNPCAHPRHMHMKVTKHLAYVRNYGWYHSRWSRAPQLLQNGTTCSPVVTKNRD